MAYGKGYTVDFSKSSCLIISSPSLTHSVHLAPLCEPFYLLLNLLHPLAPLLFPIHCHDPSYHTKGLLRSNIPQEYVHSPCLPPSTYFHSSRVFVPDILYVYRPRHLQGKRAYTGLVRQAWVFSLFGPM